MMDKLLQDIRYALRLWRRKPGFAFVAIATLALGIGANTAMFSIVNAVLLRPLPFRDADRIVSVWGRTNAFPRGLLSYAEYEEIRKQTGTFASMAFWLPQSVNITGTDEPQRLVGTFATGSFFEVLGLRAERGRLFTEEESAPGTGKPVVVISRNTWKRRFNSDPSAIGATLTVNGTPLTVVGVLEPPFNQDTAPNDGYFISADLFIPVAQFPVPNGLAAAGPVMLGVAQARAGRRYRAGDVGSRRHPQAAGRQRRAVERGQPVVVHRAVGPLAVRRAGAGIGRRHVAPGADAAVRGGRRRAADCLRQRQPAAARARGRSRARDRPARRARREPDGGRQAADDRGAAARGRVVDRRPGSWDAWRWPASHGCARRPTCRFRPICRSTGRSCSSTARSRSRWR